MSATSQPKPGLQAERTQLSWERSAFGFLVGGALVLLRQGGPLEVGRTVLAVTAAVLALLVIWLAHRRAQRINSGRTVDGHYTVTAPRSEVFVIGGATATFAAAIVVVLLFAW